MANLSTVLSGVTSVGSSVVQEKNYVRAPDTSGTQWVSSGAGLVVSTETNLSLIPEASTKTSAIKITRVSGSDYARYRFTLDESDYSKKFKIAFALKYAGLSGDYTVTVFSNTLSDYSGTSTALPLVQSSISPSSVNFYSTFDTPGSSDRYIEVRINGISGTTPLYLSGMIVGPGILTQGAAIGDWVNYTPVFTNWAATATQAKYRRVGTAMEIAVTATVTSAATGFIRISLPTGFTYNEANSAVVGSAFYGAGTGQYTGSASHQGTFVEIAGDGHTGTYGWGTVNPSGSGIQVGGVVSVRMNLAVNQWAGNGTLSIGAGAQIEYASNNGSGGTAAGVDYATGSVPGPGGSFFVATDSATVTSRQATGYLVTFSTPILETDELVIEVLFPGSTVWFPIPNGAVESYKVSQNAVYGMAFSPVDSTSVNIRLGNGGRVSTNAYGVAGAAWSNITNYKWRVRKASPSSPVGFGIASATEGGLLSVTTQTVGGNKTFAGIFSVATGTSNQTKMFIGNAGAPDIGRLGVSTAGHFFLGRSAEHISITSGGLIGINQPSPTQMMHMGNGTGAVRILMQTNGSGSQIQFNDSGNATTQILGHINTTAALQAINGTGGVTLALNATAWSSLSDESLKENIVLIPNALDKVNALRGVTFSWKDDETHASNAGVIAQEVKAVLPEAIDSSNPDGLSVRYSELVPLLLEAIKELSAEVKQLKTKSVS